MNQHVLSAKRVIMDMITHGTEAGTEQLFRTMDIASYSETAFLIRTFLDILSFELSEDEYRRVEKNITRAFSLIVKECGVRRLRRSLNTHPRYFGSRYATAEVQMQTLRNLFNEIVQSERREEL